MKLFAITLVLIVTNYVTAQNQQPALSETTLLREPFDKDDEASHSKQTNVCQSDDSGQSDASCDHPEILEVELKHNPNDIRRYVHSTSAVGIQIKNSRSYPVHYFWINVNKQPVEGQYNGIIPPYGVTATVSYVGHEFYVCKDRRDPQSKKIYQFKVDGSKSLFIVPIDNNDELTEYDKTYWDNLQKEAKWVADYEERTGYPYLSYYDSKPNGRGSRDLPTLSFWSADYIGQKHHIISNETYWHCLPDPGWSQEEANRRCRNKDGAGYIELDIEVISLYPAIFKIMNTISLIERKYIIDYATPKLLRSRAGHHGGMVTDTRTSFNTWIGRGSHPIITTIYNRAADILGLQRDSMKTKSEQLQVLHYSLNQEYSPHHDFGASGLYQQRVMTLLFYLNDQEGGTEGGGETFFPKAMGKGIKVHPGAGNSGLFYSILPDGNADDLSLHWALPIKRGEKWACNFWIWDPQFRR